ncbi:MAG: TatD family hydrolase [Patescibacteria group bacterium]|nr:TatD family hydrolase [Patescibacteria group bacterium]
MKIDFFDAHTHIQFAAYDKDRELVINRALREGVGMVTVGTKKETSRAAVEIAEKFESVWAAIGLHPIHSHKSPPDAQESGNVGKMPPNAEETLDYDFYKNLALNPKTVAIGECGLDYFRIKNNQLEIREKQKAVFIKQIELAYEVKKPLMIHCRDAFRDLIEILSAHKNLLNSPAGIAHFFSGTKEEAKKLLDLGFYFTFGSTITFPFKKDKHFDYGELVWFIPLDRILSETDAPYVAPVPYRGTRNEPAYIIHIVRKLAEIKNISVFEMQDKILENARHIFPTIFR